MGEKVFLFEAIGKAATEMANAKPEHYSEEAKQQSSVLEQLQADNEFFQREPETPIVLAGKITRRMKPTQIRVGHKNVFHPVASNFFYSCLFLLEDYHNVARFATLLAKGLFSLA